MKDVDGPGEGAPEKGPHDDLAARVAALGPWFHNLDLRGVRTAPDHFLGDFPRERFERFGSALPADLAGKSVLDIGCNAGFYSLEMKRRGAARVLGIDHDDHYLRQARLAAEVLELDIEFRQVGVYDVGSLGERFDVVLFMGVLYHLRHPLLALDLIREHACAGILVFQSLQRGSTAVAPVPEDAPFSDEAMFAAEGFPAMYFVERLYAGDWTNWWIPNRAACEAMLRAAGFTIEARASDEVLICRVAPVPFAEWASPDHPAAAYPARGPAQGTTAR